MKLTSLRFAALFCGLVGAVALTCGAHGQWILNEAKTGAESALLDVLLAGGLFSAALLLWNAGGQS